MEPTDARVACPPRILVIKLGALGDFVLALGAFRTIRRHHPGATLTLLTTKALAPLVEGSGLFDQVWHDPRLSWRDPAGWWAWRRRLRAEGFSRVYDLQNNDRTALYFHLAGPFGRPAWSGLVRGCSHRFQPPRPLTHAIDWPRAQLAAAGLGEPEPPRLDWLAGEPARFGLAERFVLLVPGCAPHRPEKRWPAAGFAAVARHLAESGVMPVVIGTAADRDATAVVAAGCGEVRDLTGVTTLADLAGLARLAVGAVGNDTGPMHLIAVAGCPTLVLFSDASDVRRCRPIGPAVAVLNRPRLADLPVDAVIAALKFSQQPAVEQKSQLFPRAECQA